MSAGKDLLCIYQLTGNIKWKTFVSDQTNIQTDEFKTDGNRIFATHVQDIRAYSISDGSLLWLKDLLDERGAFFSRSIVCDNEKIFIAGTYKIYSLNATDGNIIWKKEPNPQKVIYEVAIQNNSVLYGGNYSEKDLQGNLLRLVPQVGALDKTTGDSIWTSTIKGSGGVVMPPLISSGIVFAGTAYSSPSSFDAFDATTGERKWSYYTTEYWDYNEAIIVDDKIIANAGPYHVCAFNKNTGQLLWRTFIANDAESRKLHYYNGYVYHTQGWKLFIIDPNTGAIVYSMKGPQKQDIVTIAVGNGRVFVQGYPSLQCYETYKP